MPLAGVTILSVAVMRAFSRELKENDLSTSSRGNPLDPQVRRVAIVLIIGGLAPIFDTTIVSVALRTLALLSAHRSCLGHNTSG